MGLKDYIIDWETANEYKRNLCSFTARCFVGKKSNWSYKESIKSAKEKGKAIADGATKMQEMRVWIWKSKSEQTSELQKWMDLSSKVLCAEI